MPDNSADLLAGGGTEERKMQDHREKDRIEIVTTHAGSSPLETLQDSAKDAKSLWKDPAGEMKKC